MAVKVIELHVPQSSSSWILCSSNSTKLFYFAMATKKFHRKWVFPPFFLAYFVQIYGIKISWCFFIKRSVMFKLAFMCRFSSYSAVREKLLLLCYISLNYCTSSTFLRSTELPTANIRYSNIASHIKKGILCNQISDGLPSKWNKTI